MFKDLTLKAVYNSNNEDLSEVFYTPILREAVSFDRTSAYFSANRAWSILGEQEINID